jgi:hypothetical protein
LCIKNGVDDFCQTGPAPPPPEILDHPRPPRPLPLKVDPRPCMGAPAFFQGYGRSSSKTTETDTFKNGKTPQFRSIFLLVRKLRKILFYHNSAAKFYFPIVPQQKIYFTTIPQQIFYFSTIPKQNFYFPTIPQQKSI